MNERRVDRISRTAFLGQQRQDMDPSSLETGLALPRALNPVGAEGRWEGF